MLKRQRPSSPPPSISNIPLVDDSSHNFKRRRILPPILDGPSRGWGTSQEEDIYEEDASTSDEEGENTTASSSNRDVVEYSSANTVLRELHTLNQHRLTRAFASPSGNAAHSSAHFIDPCSYSHSICLSKSHLPPISDRLRVQAETKISLPHEPLSSNSDESRIVMQRYEDTNRLLGSLFLSRRRQLNDEYSLHSPAGPSFQ
ncbi:hypothetical protein K443DRAFT_677692 [Laccaria amethystina LaAM-08-1]|uniref:Uncharacterized protein n=1 Tax=Laccaria amethystina LaAM-08-1 TaxID=1095629 RepID=A0A0C9XXA4_9AGAR|nr:hypothetical protein K443DRAFT_677692 [Laccaria amethystina LaAM-08-1]